MAAGRMKEPMLITFTAMILAVIRQVTKIAVIIRNRCEKFIIGALALYVLLLLNPTLATEEEKHATNYGDHDENHVEERMTGMLERQ